MSLVLIIYKRCGTARQLVRGQMWGSTAPFAELILPSEGIQSTKQSSSSSLHICVQCSIVFYIFWLKQVHRGAQWVCFQATRASGRMWKLWLLERHSWSMCQMLPGKMMTGFFSCLFLCVWNQPFLRRCHIAATDAKTRLLKNTDLSVRLLGGCFK